MMWIPALVGYVLGSLNFALLVEKVKGIKFREVGTGNYGTMNVYRATQSFFWAGMTLLWDAGKGILSILISQRLSHVMGGNPEAWVVVAGLSAILGHNHSFLLRFKSGRGIATFLGTSLFINPILTILWLVDWLPGYIVTGILSVGQILSSFYTPIIFSLLPVPEYQKVFAVGAGILMVLGHLEKVSAIRSGREPRNYWNLRKKKKVEY